jgi:hypothetical protein
VQFIGKFPPAARLSRRGFVNTYKRKRLRVTLRTCAVVVTLATVIFAWFGFGCRRAWRQAQILSMIAADETEFEFRHGWRQSIGRWLPRRAQDALGETFFSKIVGVSLGGCTDEELAQCRHLDDLEWLEITWPEEITADGMRQLTTLEHLTELSLYAGCVDGDVISAIAEFKQLQSLWVEVGRGGKSLASLVHLNNLDYLDLRVDNLENLRHARFPPNLTHVLIGMGDISLPRHGRDIANAFVRFDKVINLGLAGVSTNCQTTDIDSEMLTIISKFTNLGSLDLNSTNLDDADLLHLEPLRRLEFINLFGTRVTEQGILRLVKNLPHLQDVRHEVQMSQQTQTEVNSLLLTRRNGK